MTQEFQVFNVGSVMLNLLYVPANTQALGTETLSIALSVTELPKWLEEHLN